MKPTNRLHRCVAALLVAPPHVELADPVPEVNGTAATLAPLSQLGRDGPPERQLRVEPQLDRLCLSVQVGMDVALQNW